MSTTTDSKPGEALDAQIMEEVRHYNDGNGCTRRQLVDSILILINQHSRAPLAAVGGDALDYERMATEVGRYIVLGGLSEAAVQDVAGELRRLTSTASSSAPAERPQGDGWVTFGRVKVDIENETETFERIPVTAEPEGEQEREVQCADCLTWFKPDTNHTCRQQVRRNQRSAK